jgi:hypothetical protein
MKHPGSFFFYLLLFGAFGIAISGGCKAQTPAQKAAAKKQADAKAAEEAKKKAEEEKKKKRFDNGRLTPMLSEGLVSTEEGGSLRLAKPGHWTTTVQAMKANHEDFDGRITLAAVDSKNRPLPLPHTSFEMISSRPAVLAKGRPKRVENELLVPPEATKLQVTSELVDRASGAVAEQSTADLWTLMPSHQYFMLVLAKEPTRYAYLKVTDSIRAPYEDDGGTGPPHYRVVLADGNKALPLPPNVLTWTSVAYVIWDEVNMDRMDPAQQQALVDWIHWGGRLIINGPDSLDSLRTSFLAKYLPADGGERRTFDAEQLKGLSDYWSVRKTGKPTKPLAVTKPWSGIELKPRSGAVALPNAENLFCEISVGAGSVVASAVQLAERDLVNWPGFDGFLNGALLRRPARMFRVQEDDGTWMGLQAIWDGAVERTRDAYYTTPLRWFARDAATKANAVDTPVSMPVNNFYGPMGYDIPETELKVDRPGGLGDWSEFNPVSKVARAALAEAAGVRVPGAGFVVACLAVYLIVLVPLNWMVFHALGRVEWAWISAPLIAVAGTLAVVRQAQLDIGFVRSQTEIALLELQGDHPRGHLSRYTALYSSLSSTYDLEFGDSSAVATPFPHDDSWNPSIGDSISTVAFEKYDQPRLRGVTISSASTQMIHSEQIVPLDGPIRMFSSSTSPNLKQLENKSAYNLADVILVRRRIKDRRSEITGCWVGELPSGRGMLVPPMSPLAWKRGELPFAAERKRAAEQSYGKRLNVDPLLSLAFQFPPDSDPIQGGRDEWRLVARIDDMLPGAVATPDASQTAGSTVVLAHLAYGPPRPPAPDANSPSDVMPEGRRNAFDEELGGPPPEL